ncbi:MAG: universal stress protein [Crocinitomicaceae bacterium]
MKQVLLLTDFSNNAENAVHYGIQFFGLKDCRYILLHCLYETPPFNDAVVSQATEIETDVKARLAAKMASLQKVYESNLKISSRIEIGKLKFSIHQIIKDIGPDYIVVGNRKRSDLSNFLLKSNTEEVVKEANVPVLAIPESATFESLKNPVLASDLKEGKNPKLFTSIVELFRGHGCTLKILNVHQNAEILSEAEASAGIKIDRLLGELPHDFYYNEHESIPEGIVQFAKQEESSMLILIARKHNLFERIFGKSVTSTMAQLADIPLLVLHES